MEISHQELMREAEAMALVIRFQDRHIAVLEQRIAALEQQATDSTQAEDDSQ
jgi:hypothetical protein